MNLKQSLVTLSIANDIDINGIEKNLRAWLDEQGSLGEDTWLLMYADDGVIWGKRIDGHLKLSSDVFGARQAILHPDTLQRAYLFGDEGQIEVWKEEGAFHARKITDGASGPIETLDRDLILWGTKKVSESKEGFTWMEDGEQGLGHAVPLIVDTQDLDPEILKRPLRLRVRQYIDYQVNHGQAYVSASRLVKVFTAR